MFLTVHDDAQIVDAAMRSGGTGHVLKRRLSTELLKAVQDARGSFVHLPQVLTRAGEAPVLQCSFTPERQSSLVPARQVGSA